MTFFQCKSAGNISWITQPLPSLEWREIFVSGSLERISLPMDIDIWMNEKYLTQPSKNHINIVVRDGDTVKLACGNVFLATTDPAGHVVPISQEQLRWFGAHQKVLCDTDGTFLFVVDVQNENKPVMEGAL